MMKSQSVRLWIVSVTGVAVLAIFWGLKSVSSALQLNQQTLVQSLDQELLVLTSATHSAIQALRWQLLDVTKAEMSERQSHGADVKPTRTLSNSAFTGLALLEWSQNEWKLNWLTVTSQMQGALTVKMIRDRVSEWSMQGSDPVQFQKISDLAGQPYFAALMPLVRGASRLMAVGIFQPAQFPLVLSAAQTRDVKVVNDKGFALALSHPAYLGASLRQQHFIQELLGQDELSLRREFKNEQGAKVIAAGQRVPETNLFLVVEAPLPATGIFILKNWLFLLFSGAIGIGLTWFFLRRFFNESFAQNYQLAEQLEFLKTQMRERGSVLDRAPRSLPLGENDAELDFIEDTPIAPAPEAKQSVVSPTLKPLGKIIESAVERVKRRYPTVQPELELVGLKDLESAGEEGQLKTAVEEILRNAFEAVTNVTGEKKITVFAEKFAEYVRVSISDTGCGIDAANLNKVFEPFYTTKNSDGVARGLGLNVVRRVVEELNGRVQIFSEGRGTRVELELPLDVDRGIPHLTAAQAEAPEFQMLNLDFDELEKKQSKALPSVNIRKPKVRFLD